MVGCNLADGEGGSLEEAGKKREEGKSRSGEVK